MTRSLEEATEQEEMVFMFKEQGYLTINIAEESAPGWIVEPLKDPCQVSLLVIMKMTALLRYIIQIFKREVDSRDPDCGPVQRTVKIMEIKCNPPTTELRNSINLDGIEPQCRFNISFNPKMDRNSNSKHCDKEQLAS